MCSSDLEEFEMLQNQIIYVSATPSDYELQRSEGIVVEQIIRPTGLLDPVIELKPTKNQIDDILDEIEKVVNKNERVLITTLTKKMAEELVKFFQNLEIKSKYIHSDVDTLERVKILNDLRLGNFDVLVGINLLREGLDLPEVSLVIILDADKEGFLRSKRSLIQTIGRAARNLNGRAIMFADRMTESMKKTIDVTNQRRKKQLKYNRENNITPTQIIKNINESFNYESNETQKIDEVEKSFDLNISESEKQKRIKSLRKDMEKAAKELNFIEAARLRDIMLKYKKSGS